MHAVGPFVFDGEGGVSAGDVDLGYAAGDAVEAGRETHCVEWVLDAVRGLDSALGEAFDGVFPCGDQIDVVLVEDLEVALF